MEPERRRFDRYDSPETLVQIGSGANARQGHLADFSLGGCCCIVDGTPEEASEVEIRVKPACQNDWSGPLHGRVKRRWNGPDRHPGCAIEFAETLSPLLTPEIRPLMAMPLRDERSTRSRFERQKDLALGDVRFLQDAIEKTKACQFSLFLAGVTISVSLAGLYFAIRGNVLSSTRSSESPWLAVFALMPGVLSLPLTAMFMQKICSINKYSAFCTILQRGLAWGVLPACYRGWEDACSHYVNLAKSRSVPLLPQFQLAKWEEATRKTKNLSLRHVNVFVMVAMLTFGTILIFSLIIAWLHFNELKPSGNHYTVTIATATLIVGAAALVFCRTCESLRRGRHSYEVMLHAYACILEHCPPAAV